MIYNISYKTLTDPKPLRIGFDKVDRSKINDGTKYLVLVGPKKYDSIYDRIRYLISLKSGILHKNSQKQQK